MIYYLLNIYRDGKKCTRVWYVGDNKLSREYPKVITEILESLQKQFGELVIRRGNTHTFLRNEH